MYERSPQKSPQLTILNPRSRALTDDADALVSAPKNVREALNEVGVHPGKHSRQSEVTLLCSRALGSGSVVKSLVQNIKDAYA
jgi:hypothetical protein